MHMHISPRRCLTSMPALVLLLLTSLSVGPAASADSLSSETTQAGGRDISVFRDHNVAVTVSGGTATAINKCVNDASDGLIQNQRNACNQAASAGNVVTVDSITVSASKNITIDVTGGTAASINECVNKASGGSSQDQQNVCVQVGSSGNAVDVGDLKVLASKNITIKITGGIAVAIFNCLSHASAGSVATQRNACAQVAGVGSSTSRGRISIQDSKDVTITVDGALVATIRKGHAQIPARAA